MSKHTEGPWRVSESVHRLPEIYGANDNCVADRVYNGNAQHIVTCVNSHEELIKALGALVRFNESDPDLYDGDDDGTLGRLMFTAREALAKAEGGENE